MDDSRKAVNMLQRGDHDVFKVRPTEYDMSKEFLDSLPKLIAEPLLLANRSGEYTKQS